MKKKWLITLLAVALICATAVGLAACDNGPGDDAAKVKVTFYNGSEVLKTVEIDKGAKAEAFTPAIEGYNFIGWYATPSLRIEFDFDAAIEEDTSVFAKVSSKNQPDDTRSWYIAGTGAGAVLHESSWGAVYEDAQKLTKAADANEFTITLDLFQGDQFQFFIGKGGSDGSWWLNQRGYGYLETIKGADGVDHFTAAGGLGEPTTKKMNITVAVEGNYTFTLKTHPADDYYDTANAQYTEANKEGFNTSDIDTITWVRNGDTISQPVLVEDTFDYYIKGAVVTDWQAPKDAQYKMTEADGVLTLTIALTEGDQIMFYGYNPETEADSNTYIKADALDTENSTEHITGTTGNMTVGAAGTYTFTYTKETKVLVVTYQA